jgi:hypothetical protein
VQRPTGVIILAVLYWLSAFCLLLIGAVMAVGFTAFSGMAAGMASLFVGFGVIGGIVLLGLGAAMALVGYGLFQLQEWARITTIVLFAIGFAGGLFGLIHPIGFGRISASIRMALDGLILWYLVQPQIGRVFRRA